MLQGVANKKMSKNHPSTTLPKFNSSPLKSYLPNRKVVFHPIIFSGVKLREGKHQEFQHRSDPK